MSSPVLLSCAALLAGTVVCCAPADKEPPARSSTELTVIRRTGKHLDSLIRTDTILRTVAVDPAVRPVDIYFCRDSLRIPLILPAGGFTRNPAQKKECNWERYPASVRCCTYDDRDRVLSLAVDAAGAREEWTYSYDSLDRVTECKGWWRVYTVRYNPDGTIALLAERQNDNWREMEFAYTAR